MGASNSVASSEKRRQLSSSSSSSYYPPADDVAKDDMDMLVGLETGGTAVLQLTPTQSCSLHGWANPKRTLAWEDLVRNPKITLKKCLDEGLTPQQLHEMQPDLSSWISRKQVSFSDVPYMAAHWKLHPIEHLKGDISDLVGYDARVLQRLGISYRYLRERLQMTDDWMRMLHYRPKEWKDFLGFGELEAEQMGDLRLERVFMMDPGMVRVAMNVP